MVSRQLHNFKFIKNRDYIDIFKRQNLIGFSHRFKTDLDRKEHLAYLKWKDGFRGTGCGHGATQQRKHFSPTCNICGHTESATAHTLFQRVRFGVRKALFICVEMATTTKGLSESYKGARLGITEKTARPFMHKVREAMKASGNHPIDAIIHINEFVIGGREQCKVGRSYDGKNKKAVYAVQLTEDGKVRRMYSIRTDNFLGKELKRMLHAHIDGEAKVTTHIWRVYWPLAKEYDIEQIPNNGG